MNCGVDGSGWNPPFVRVSDLVTVDLDVAIAQGGPFTACQSYVWAFKQFGGEFGREFYLHFGIVLDEIDVRLQSLPSSWLRLLSRKVAAILVPSVVLVNRVSCS